MHNPWHAFDLKWNLPPLPNADQPVFLLASIWRSGSTLTQRLLCSDTSIFLWGEPYGDAGIVPSLAHSAKGLLRKDWPAPSHFLSPHDPQHRPVIDNPHQYWIANIYPDPHSLRQSYRQMLDQLFQSPAKAWNRTRFGIKEVRYDGNTAHFLQWIYPDARFVFLTRNPYDAWASYKGAKWYYQWPKMLVEDVRTFAKLWKRNAEGFQAFRQDHRAMFLRFEDLFFNNEDSLTALESHCSLTIQRSVMTEKIRGMSKPAMPISEREQTAISQICAPLAQQFGYLGPKNTLENP